jgi:energy-coupling factor transporter ATP-binding protein EcfA2
MQSGSGVDLFRGFNEDEVSEVLRRCAGCSRFVLIGPPRSGKTFFKEKYLKDRPGAGVTVDEYTLGISTTAKTEREEARGESGISEKVMKYLKRMIPLIKRLRENVEVDDEELRRVLGDEAPRLVVEGVKRSIGDSSYRAYYIPWNSNEVRKCVEEPNACAFGADVGKALKLIKEAFGDRRIRWFRAEYVPPGLVEEVIDLIRVKGEDGAREELKGWVEAYSKAIDILRRVLGLGDDLFMWDELATGFLSNFMNNYASYVIGGLATALMDAATLALISVLTYMAFKREGEGYIKGIIELKRSLERLRRSDGEFNELGKLLIHRVAYAMGMSYDEAKEALIDITGLSIDELERRVYEIERRIKELEVKVDELNRWVSLLKQKFAADIIIADKVDFEQGIIYPNIKVENGELKIRVGDGYHNVVRAGKFNELISDVKSMLMGNGVVVVVGPKGIGKSTLVATVIWELLNNHEIGLVTRVDVLNSNNYHEFKRFVENYGEGFSKYFGRLLILYDPVSTKAYEEVGIDMKTPIQTNTELTIRNLVDVVNSIGSEASRPFVFIVLPSDVYNVLSEEIRDSLKRYSRDVSLNDVEFLAELIREYTKTRDKPNRCELSSDVLSQLASELAKFDSGHALIARLVGEELARNNCDVSKIEELINNAKGRAETFIILQINGLFKVHENPDTAKALVEVFALRSPFISAVKPGDSILTLGIVELIGEARGAKILYGAEGEELRSWLAIRQHDLIEETIGKLLDCIEGRGKGCKVLGDALKPWKTTRVIELLRKVSEKINDVDSAVEYFASNYGERLTSTLKVFSNECWKRAAYIIGHALAENPIMPGHRELSVFLHLSKTGIEPLRDELNRLGVDDDKLRLIISLAEYYANYYASIVASLGDALKKCDIDDYLIVYNKIPPLIMRLIRNHTSALAGVFINKYDEAIAEIKRLLNIIKNRREIYHDEAHYSLGLATIIANAAESGMPVEPSDADAALHIASLAIRRFVFIHPIIPISVLAPLRDKAPQRYLEVLAFALDKVSRPDILGFMCPDLDTVMYILNEFDYILNKYGDGVKGHAWTLVHAIDASINSLYKCLKHCGDYTFEYMNMNTSFRTKLEHIVSRVAGLLNEIERLNPSLDIIAWSYALLPALDNKCVRALMERVLGIDVVNKAIEVAGKLSGLRGSVQELIREDFKGFVESWLAETGENTTREILDKTVAFKYALAQYKLNNDELDEAERLFNEAAVESKEIGDYVNYLDSRHWALRTEAIKGPLAGDDLVRLVNGFRQLYEEAKKYKKYMDVFLFTDILGGYLVSLALMGGDEEIRRIEELLKEQWQVLRFPVLKPTLTRLALNALLSPRVGLSGELKDRLIVKPGEIIVALGLGYIDINSLPALKATYGTLELGDETRLCEEINDPIMHDLCVRNILATAYIKELSQQEGNLRQALIVSFQWWISKKAGLDLLEKLGLDAESLNDELKRLTHELSGKSLLSVLSFSYCFEHQQLHCSLYHLTYMLYALINGNEKLAKAHALAGAMIFTDKLPVRLFLETYRACCDPNNEEFRRAIAKLFFYHV